MINLSWQIIEQQRHMMGTDVSIHLAVSVEAVELAQAAITECFIWLDEMAARLTRFDASSELMQMNCSGGSWFAASDILFDCMVVALEAANDTDGLFDPALLPQLVATGYDKDFDSIAYHECGPALQNPGAGGKWRAIRIDATNRRIFLPSDVQVDLGGIAKGWAADVAIDRFFAQFTNVIVNVGGDIRLRGGPEPGKLWAVGVDNPHLADANNTDYLAIVTPGQGAIATSGSTRRWWLQENVVQHHVIDPRTGKPATIWLTGEQANPYETNDLIAAATALAPSAVQAEVAAKVALLRGFPHALHAVEDAWQSSPELGVALILVLGSGAVWCSLNIESYLQQYGGDSSLWLKSH
jgi:FAD:protein FMN transferase